MKKSFNASQKGAVSSWIIPLVIVVLGIVGLVYLASKSKPNIASPDEILTIRDNDWVRGSRDAKAVLIEYGDFQCPACGAYFPVLTELENQFGNDLAVVFRHFPLSSHKNAIPAALAAQAAGMQGKFWEMHDAIFSSQAQWSSVNNAAELFRDGAENLGLDMAKYNADIASTGVRKTIDADKLEGIGLGVNSTPTFYLNGKKLEKNPQSKEAFAGLIEEAIKTGDSTSDNATTTQAYHIHTDIALWVNGAKVDLSQARYQSTKEQELNKFIHLHSGVGHVLHVHAENQTIGAFVASLKDIKPTTPASVWINGVESPLGLNYVPQDLDRILIAYGTESDSALSARAKTVTDEACIYSEKCPERGTPPEEECVGGLGTTCDEDHD